MNAVGAFCMNDPVETQAKALLRWDGTIPAWGIVLLGVAWAGYSLNENQDLKSRVSILENNQTAQVKRVDELEKQQRDQTAVLGGMRSDIQVVKELMLRLEKRFDPPKP